MCVQVDEDSLRELFNKYGAVQEWIVCPASECALVCCQSTEDGIRIKESLDSNSDMVGIVQFASKPDVDVIIEQSREISPRSWLSESSNSSGGLPPPGECIPSSSASPSTPFSVALSTSGWDSSDSNAPTSFGRQSSEATTPGSSLWSDSGFLSGLSSPWHPGVTVTSSTTSPQGSTGPDGGDPTITSSNPSISPFLPNGLL